MNQRSPSRQAFSLFLLLSLITTQLCFGNPSPEWVRSFEKGNLYEKGGLRIVELEGSFYEMGRQYGALTREHLKRFTTSNQQLENKCLINYKDLLNDLISGMWDLYPRRQQELLLGMADTSGLTIRELIVIDQNLAISFFLNNGFGCSFFSAWGDQTEDGKVITGRNFDWYPGFRELKDEVIVVIYKPTDGSIRSATVVLNGMICGLTGINEEGVYLSLNNGMNTFGPVIRHNRTPYLNCLSEFLWDSPNTEILADNIHNTRAQFPNIVNVADSTKAISFETNHYESKKREGLLPDQLIATNHMLHPDWCVVPLPCPTESRRRYQNIKNLAEEFKGQVNVDIMKKIFDTPLHHQNGERADGPTPIWKHPTNPNVTIYQVICTPETREIWVKIPLYNEWTHLDLNPFFSRK